MKNEYFWAGGTGGESGDNLFPMRLFRRFSSALSKMRRNERERSREVSRERRRVETRMGG